MAKKTTIGHSAPALEQEQIESQLKQGFLWLRFSDPGLEAGFRRYHLAETRPAMYVVVTLGVLMYAASGLIDLITAGSHTTTFLLLRFGIGVPALLGTGLAVLLSRSDWHVQWAGFLGVTIAGWVVVAMLVLLPLERQQYYMIGMTVIIFVPYCFFRLATRFACATGIAMTAGYCIAMPLFREIALWDWVQATYFLVLANLVGFTACYLIEYYLRKTFLTTTLLSIQWRQLEEANLHLYELSTTDALTGVASRRHLEEFLRRIWRQAKRDDFPVTLLMLDIDWFKELNDQYGHPAGDECMVQFARVAASYARRPLDLVGRFGGDEFLLVLGNMTLSEGEGIAGRLCESVRALALPHEKSPKGLMTISIGVASLVPAGDQSPGDLLKLADVALYAAKDRGRDQVVVQAVARNNQITDRFVEPI